MTIYYSKSNQAFYDSTIHNRLPEDAAAISPANLDALDAVHLAYTLPDAGDTGDVAPS